MKSSTPELLKFQKLMRRLKESRRGTIGLLEGMWLAVGKNCPRGDIGRFSNEEIAIMVDWDGDPDELISALVECRWLDVCDTYRLVVHDWEDHCPTYIKGGLAKRGEAIAIGVASEVQAEPESATTLACTLATTLAYTSEVPSTKPSLAKPDQAKPNTPLPPRGKEAGFNPSEVVLPTEINSPEMQAAWLLWCKHRAEIKKPLKPTMVEQQLNQFVQWGQNRSIAAIRHTVARGWQGIQEPEVRRNGKIVNPEIGDLF